ncbi:hypothetical protein IBE03_09720, partial [Francisella tularensis]|uniref:hypothetical protein n=1 Tax=Francisella tularensis TaxID=263 RepID=UPI001C0EA719
FEDQLASIVADSKKVGTQGDRLDDTKKLWSSPILAIKNRQLFEGKTFTESQESSFDADGPS